MTDDDRDPPSPTNVGLILAALWFGIGVLGCAGAGFAIGFVSESMGILASYVGFPLFAGGVAALLVAPFLRRSGTGLAVGAPVGCGCFSLLATLFAVVVFFVAIFPAL
jgi:hypothetical protein